MSCKDDKCITPLLKRNMQHKLFVEVICENITVFALLVFMAESQLPTALAAACGVCFAGRGIRLLILRNTGACIAQQP